MKARARLARPGVLRVLKGSAAALAALLLHGVAGAQTVSLSNGESLVATIDSYHYGSLLLRSPRTGLTRIDAGLIGSFTAIGPFTVNTSAGERLLANTIEGTTNGLVAHTRFGPITLAWHEVAAIDRTAEATNAVAALASRSAGEKEPRTIVTITASMIGNQFSDFFGVRRSSLWASEMNYTRHLGLRTQLSINVPLYHQTMRTTDLDGVHVEHATGIGDVTLSASRIIELPVGWPQLQVRARLGFPTGRSSGPAATTLLGLSSGNWSAGAEVGLNMPLLGGTLIGGVGYTRYWSAAGGGTPHEDRSWAYGYSTDLGPARRITFSMTGSTLGRGTDRASPAYGGVSIDQNLPSGFSISPSFAHGLNADAQDYLIGLSLSKSW